MEDFLFTGLNEFQKKAVLHRDGPLLVLAGAGTGKTRAISHRVAYMVREGVAPESILAITFTNKAAGEMKERIGLLLKELSKSKLQKTNNKQILSLNGQNFEDNCSENLQIGKTPFISTFHSLGVHILRKHGKVIDIPNSFSILDKNDSLGIIKSVLKELEMDPKQFPPQKMLNMISNFKGELIFVDEYVKNNGSDFFPKKFGAIWFGYEKKLKEQKVLDFSDLIARTVFLFRNKKEIADYYQNLWKYVLIDEYQDTNKGQYELSKILAEKHNNICAIGDVDQSIYGFRGADFKNILKFEKDYSNLVSISFEENYRSTQNILDAAGSVIEKNKMRKPKNLFSQKDKGEGISLFEAIDEEDEAVFVVSKIKELSKGGDSFSDTAVLFRANYQSRALEEVCIRDKVPYQMLGTRFYQRQEVKDILAFIQVALNPDDRTSFERVVNVPARGIGAVTLSKYFNGENLPVAAAEKIKTFLDLLNKIKTASKTMIASELILFVMQESGYQKMLENGNEQEKDRLENLKELFNIAMRYDDFSEGENENENADESKDVSTKGIKKLLEDAVLAGDQDNLDNKKDAVKLMTVHSAKGLEFKNVFVVGMEEGLFPHSLSMMESPEKREEERRLFYVAITRAKEKLFLTFTINRMVFGSRQINTPSSFLSDIPDHLFKFEERGDDWDDGSEKVIEYL